MAAPMVPDEYESDVHRWWHLSDASPELLEALGDGWLPAGRVLDIGCGLGTELGYLGSLGRSVVGVDLSHAALRGATTSHPSARFLRADALRLPFREGVFGSALDRGCFHYLRSGARREYEREVRRVLEPGGRLLLRACLTSAGRPNGIDESTIRRTFSRWGLFALAEARIPSDTRTMPAIVTRLESPAAS
jgi:SAM-dependent methyltransferase